MAVEAIVAVGVEGGETVIEVMAEGEGEGDMVAGKRVGVEVVDGEVAGVEGGEILGVLGEVGKRDLPLV